MPRVLGKKRSERFSISPLCDWRFAHLEFLRRLGEIADMEMLFVVLTLVPAFMALAAAIRPLGGALAARLRRARREKAWVRDHAH